jgi:diacylglycerol kinase family enzyme
MERLWLISNYASGSASEEKCDAIQAIMEERGMVLVRRTTFPDDPLPSVEDLIAAEVDTVVLFAGDGTVNAAACKYDKWHGKALILPGGTMNVLARRLHGEAEPHAIVHAAHEKPNLRTLPFVESGPHRAFCALIVGPAAAWAVAREAVRYRRFKRLLRAARVAWARTWSRGVTLFDGTRKRGNYKALLIAPEDGWLRITAFSTATLGQALRLGWEWLWGNFHNAPTVDDTRSAHVTVTGRRALHALFDGEEAKLQCPAQISAGTSNLRFITTVEGA